MNSLFFGDFSFMIYQYQHFSDISYTSWECLDQLCNALLKFTCKLLSSDAFIHIVKFYSTNNVYIESKEWSSNVPFISSFTTRWPFYWPSKRVLKIKRWTLLFRFFSDFVQFYNISNISELTDRPCCLIKLIYRRWKTISIPPWFKAWHQNE